MGKVIDFLLTDSWEEYKRVRLYKQIGEACKVMSREQYGRADIVAFDEFGNGFIIEIINTEEESYTDYKKENYPQEFEFFTIKCGEPIKLHI